MTLDELLSLKRDVESEFAEPVPAFSLMQKRLDAGQANGFLRSLADVPLRELPTLFEASAPSLVKAARRGRGLLPDLIANVRTLSAPRSTFLSAHGDDEAEPLLSVGYSAVAPDDYQVEIRMQDPNVRTILLAQDIVLRAGGQARVGEYFNLEAHAGRAASAGGTGGLAIGGSIGHPKGPAGTIGLFARSPAGVGVFSNSHILARCGRAKIDDNVLAPHPKDSDAATVVGRLREFNNLIGDDAVASDAAFALLDEGVQFQGNIIPKGMQQAGRTIVAARTAPEPGTLKVAKIGRTSGYTSGTLSAMGVDLKISYASFGDVKLTGMLEILWAKPSAAFSQSGDSGSVVYRPDTMEAIGLVVGGGVRLVDGVKEGVSIVCPIDPIMKEWALSFV